MPRIHIFRLGGSPDRGAPPELEAATPLLSLEGLSVGVDNLRPDVILRARFADAARAQIARSIARHGQVDGLLAAETSQSSPGPSWLRSQAGTASRSKTEPADWKSMLTELHVAGLNRAKKEEKIAIDLLA